MKTLDPNRPSILPGFIEKFGLFGRFPCEEARRMYDERTSYGPLGWMKIKSHFIDEIEHEAGCPALEVGATEEINRLLDAD